MLRLFYCIPSLIYFITIIGKDLFYGYLKIQNSVIIFHHLIERNIKKMGLVFVANGCEYITL